MAGHVASSAEVVFEILEQWGLKKYIEDFKCISTTALLVIACVYITIVGSIGSISCKMWSMCLLSAGRFMHVISLLNAFESRTYFSMSYAASCVVYT